MRHCSPRSCSMIELSLPMRLRQCSSSLRGPCTSPSSPPPPAGDSASLKSFSICSHQSVTSPSSLATTDGLAAAAWIAAGLFSICTGAGRAKLTLSSGRQGWCGNANDAGGQISGERTAVRTRPGPARTLSSGSLGSISASFMPPARLLMALSITTTHFFCSVSSSSFSFGFIFFM